ncbi:MAG: NAD+ synthase [Thermoplasmata archaeon]
MIPDLVPPTPPHAEETIVAFLRSHCLHHGLDGGVVGLSGGIDSALVAHLAAEALGPRRVLGLLLPDAIVPESLRVETEAFADALGIERRTIPIDGMVGAVEQALPEVRDPVTRGNAKARLRMILLYAVARERHRVVLGTGNKSELLLGYFTKWGDGGVDLLPIGDLYKTGVRALAAARGLPEAIRRRPPSAGLWEGQTDEAELGLPYEEADRILYGLELGQDEPSIVRRTGLPPDRVASIVRRVAGTHHKRTMPPIPPLGGRTLGVDWRI